MEKEVVYSTEAPKPIGPYSQAVWAGDTLFVSGQIALDPASGELIQGNIETETKAVLNNVKAILDKAGIGFSNIVKTSIFLKNMDDFAAVNAVYVSDLTVI